MNRTYWLLVVLSLSACSSETPPPTDPGTAHASSSRKKPRGAKALSAEQLRHVMNKKSTAIAGCYELSDNKDLSSMTIEFEVGMDGRVNDERIADAAVDNVLRDCVLGVVRDARFPKSGAATDVSWPLRFRSQSE